MTESTTPVEGAGPDPQGESGTGYAYDPPQHASPGGEAMGGDTIGPPTGLGAVDPQNGHAFDLQNGKAAGPPNGAVNGPGILCEHVSRSFGAVHAVQDLSFAAPRGKVTALVGPNGSGKSTLMLMLASLLAPDSGRVLVHGVDPSQDSAAVRATVGWMPDQFGAWDSLRVSEVLEVMARAYFLPGEQIRSRVDELLMLMDLVPLAAQPAHVLSRGQKQRLGLARALVHRPEVLVLDEPASGLDPASRRRLLRVLRQVAEQGVTVLVSSHILSELEEMADHVVFLDAGHVVDSSSVRDLAERPRPWRIESLDVSALSRALGDLGVRHHGVVDPAQTSGGHAEALVDLPDEATASRLLRDLAGKDAAVVAFGPATGRLEAAYLASEAADREGAL
ncbi:ABC transporter ATP-binding protein [Brachybacterium sacelli]|uniref:ABC-2 type transport system ATP-binding protein n=1 Tax=Brachybacterium sacelli TaxID=173364 RepID=A0ABS4WWB7_9MICO|nr:ABC transporter ATP-binding protein [Brachybacterium sacelli]MBP2380258.1 ABC-2 type transport system ATP-binding protein [Brachybacterium sacelli]